ncbi:MAG: ABC-type transport auxiliary lipoprotein family protein [Gallionella sp.]
MNHNDMTWLTRFAALAPTAAILALVVGGCSVLPPPLPPDNVYLLEAGTVPVTASAKRDAVLAVGQPRARAGFDTARMIWVRQAHGLETYARNRWADTPSRMLEPLIRQALQRSGAFRAVVPQPSGVAAGLRLDTELVRLQQDFTVKPSEVRLTLGAQLIDSATQRVIATAEFDETEKCESEDAYGGVRAANRALERLLVRVAEFCAANTR